MSNGFEYLVMLTGCLVILFEIVLNNKKRTNYKYTKNMNKLPNHMLNKAARCKEGVHRPWDSIYMRFKNKKN